MLTDKKKKKATVAAAPSDQQNHAKEQASFAKPAKRKPSLSERMASQLSFTSKKAEVKEDVTKADTPGFRNKQIEEQEPYYYQHMNHIRNLRKSDHLASAKSI